MERKCYPCGKYDIIKTRMTTAIRCKAIWNYIKHIWKIINKKIRKRRIYKESLESGMCDVIKIRLKRRDATRSGKGNQPLNIKTAVEQPLLKQRLPNFR